MQRIAVMEAALFPGAAASATRAPANLEAAIQEIDTRLSRVENALGIKRERSQQEERAPEKIQEVQVQQADREAIREKNEAAVTRKSRSKTKSSEKSSEKAVEVSSPQKGEPDRESAVAWMGHSAGFDALPKGLQASAERSYKEWSKENPERAETFSLREYVEYVQDKDADRQANQQVVAKTKRSVADFIDPAARQKVEEAVARSNGRDRTPQLARA